MFKGVGMRRDKRSCGTFSLPCANAKNIGCVQCKQQFFLKEFSPLKGSVPLMLQCGHIICDPCSRNASTKPCPLCDIKPEDIVDKKSQLPLNIYALGLMVLSYNSVNQIDDSEITFQQPLSLKSRQNLSRGQCSECGIQANFRCIQCAVLFCIPCYQKIHGRALQNHTKVPMMEQNSNDPLQLRTTCTESCSDQLRFYCNDCDTAACPHCMVIRHQKHNIISLHTKNVDHWSVYDAACVDVSRSIVRIEQLQKKLKTMTVQPKLQTKESEEARVTEHFLQLHGILQNMEEKLLKQIREQQNYFSKNLEELQKQLKANHDKLTTAIQIAASATENIDYVDLVEVTGSLEKLANIPCHLVEDPVPPNQKIQFDVDKTIFNHLQEHCSITVPPIHGYSLVSKDQLPANYEIEPLPCDPFLTKSLGAPNFLQRSNNASTADLNLPVEPLESRFLAEGSAMAVRPMHIIDPFLFYVQLKSSQGKMQELERGLTTIANTSASVPTELVPNMMYLVKMDNENSWCRGRATNIKTLESTKCDIVLFDYGMTKENVSISDLRTIPAQYATRPSMTLKCALTDVVPIDGTWHDAAIETFTKLLNDADVLNMYINTITGSNYYVKLSKLDGQVKTDIGETLIHFKYASRNSPHQMMRMNPRSMRTYYKDYLRLDKYDEVEVLNIESPSSIYVQRINQSNQQAKKKLLQEMTDEYVHNPSIGHIDEAEIGFPCAVHGIDGYWYRAIICEVIDEETFKVFFVDYGYTLEYNYKAIKRLRDKYMKTRTMAIKVSLDNIVPPCGENGIWSTNASQYVEMCIGDSNDRIKLIPLEKLGDSYSVLIFYCGNQNLAANLVKKKLAKYRVPGKPKKKFNKKQNKDNLMEVLTYNMEFEQLQNSNANKEDKDDEGDAFKLRILIHEVVSPDCIYVANAKDAEPNANFRTELQEFYNVYHTKPKENWTKDDICVAYSAKDTHFYRAKILDIKSPDEVTVFFYDIGLKDTVSTKDIQPLHRKFSQLAAYTFKIKLAGILPCGGSGTWPSHSIQKLRDIISDNEHSKFFISKTENSDDAVIPVELWMKEAKMDGPLAPTRVEMNSINWMLVDEGVALPIKNYAAKRDKILAYIFQKQLKKRRKAMKTVKLLEERVKWYKNGDNLGDCVEVDVNESVRSICSLTTDSTSEDDGSCLEGPQNDIPSQSTLSSWIPAQPILADRFVGLATYIDYNSIVYLHSKEENGKTVEFIEKKLGEKFKDCKTEKCDAEWKANDLCIAQYHGDKKWYRAKVLKILEKDSVEVQFVDYGNVEELEVEKLKKNIILGDIPIQCTNCKVFGLTANNDTDKFEEVVLDTIHSELIGVPIEVTILKREEDFLLVSINLLPDATRKHKCDLIKHLIKKYNFDFKPGSDHEVTNSNSISDISNSSNAVVEKRTDALETFEKSIETGSIKLNNAIPADKIILDQYTNMLETDGGKNTDIENLSWSKIEKHITTSTPHSPLSIENLATYNSIEIPEAISEIEIKITGCLVLTEIFAQLQENSHCQKLNEYYTSYQRITKDIQKNACNQPLIKQLVPGTVCCTEFSEDKQWYRCLIQEVTPHPKKRKYVTVKFHFVDFGNDDIVEKMHTKKHNVRCMKSEWLEVPMMAVKCQLWSEKKDSDLGAERNKILHQMKNMDNKVLKVTIKEKVDDIFYIDCFKEKESKVIICDPLEEGSKKEWSKEESLLPCAEKLD